MSDIPNKYRSVPFWSWNDKLDKDELVSQIEWMHKNGIGGFFMHARGGLKTEYLSKEWFECIEACLKKAKELDMEAYAYDENGWPSGFVGGKLLENELYRDRYLTHSFGRFDKNAIASFKIDGGNLIRVFEGNDVLNVFVNVSNSTVDVCNPAVVKDFIKFTHEEYKKHDIYGNLKGFFTDEPQYYRYETPFSLELARVFKEKFGEDITERIGLLFVDKNGYEDYRYKYYKTLHELFVNNYGKQVFDWCDKNNYKFTGHYIEESRLYFQMSCCGGIMGLYEYEHIPGIDFLGRNISSNPIAKQLGSVASQLGKEQRLAEIYACAGWDATPNELKTITEALMCEGVNLVCQHLLPYKEHGQRKRDYPEHYSAINPWVNKSFKYFNDYIAEIGMKLAKSTEITDVGLFMPIRSCYLNFKRFEKDPNNMCNVGKIDSSYAEAYKMLQNNHISYHIIDEDILANHGFIDGDYLGVGKYKYKYLIFPSEVLTMDKTTEKLLNEFIKNGGKVLLLGNKPKYLEGSSFDYKYLKTNTSIDEILNSQKYKISKTENVLSSFYRDENGKEFLYLVNIGENTSFLVNNISISLKKYESKILYLDELKERKNELVNYLELNGEFEVKEEVNNFLMIDKISVSKDDKIYSDVINVMGALMKFIKESYNGVLYLKYNFDIRTLPETCFALIEDMNILDVFVNGRSVKKSGFVLEKELGKYNIVNNLKIGINELKVKINFYEDEIVKYALFGENVQESIRNCLVYDTTIEPIYLMGDFGVFGDFTNQDNCYVANTFYIDKQPNRVSNLVTDGFPFFRGEIKLGKKVKVDSTNINLLVNHRFQLIDVFVNNQFVDKLMFKNETKISEFLKKGDNEIVLNYIISNRNLLGPHHLPVLEPLNVGPNSFEVKDSWNAEGKSNYLLDRYSFVKVIN